MTSRPPSDPPPPGPDAPADAPPAGASADAPAASAAPAAARPAKKAAAGRKGKAPAAAGEPTVQDVVEQILSDPRVVYFPVKHFSPACAYHVEKLIREVRPAAVLVEGPQDADALIPYIVHPDTRAPFTIFSSYVDRANAFGQNGVLSPSDAVPVRFRGWWPMTDYAPEFVALRAGHEVGAALGFCDVPLLATIPHRHVREREATRAVDDRHLATNAYFAALAARQRRRSFDEFWNANFEVGAPQTDPRAFMRNVLAFAYCARKSAESVGPAAEGAPAPLEADGTLLREGHMRFVLDAALKAHPGGRVVVVTGAFHSVALPWTRKQKAPVKADKNLETMLTAHSFAALANLYHLNRMPAYAQAVWEEVQGGAGEPYNAAALRLLIEVMRRARDRGEGVSTADAVGAYRVARNLAVLRGDRETTLEDVLDAVRMGYVKGDARVRGGTIEAATREVLVGVRLGRVTSEAGQAPLVRDFYAQCKAHKLDITGAAKQVRCDLGKQEGHRLKSAFLHQCDFLGVPMFFDIEPADYRTGAPAAHYKGPDLVSGANMHLLGETWGVKWTVEVDDRLLELADRGASLAQAAAATLREQLVAAAGNAAETTRLLLRSAQMGLEEVFDALLGAVEDAVVVDSQFDNLVGALHDFVVLHSYRDHVATSGHARVLATITTLFGKACLVLPVVANTPPEATGPVLDRLQTLVRVALTFEALELDRQLLVEKLAEAAADADGNPTLRGAAFGVLFSLGATREKVVAAELDSYLLGAPDRVRQAGAFLDGLFMSSKSIFIGSPRLIRAITAVLRELDWPTFKALLPDLRRAFTQFIPAEIDTISVKVSEELGIDPPPARDVPVPDALARLCAATDARVERALEGWW